MPCVTSSRWRRATGESFWITTEGFIGGAVGHRQAGDDDGDVVVDMKYAVGGGWEVAVHCQVAGARAEDGDDSVHDQVAVGQQDGAGDASRVNGVPVRRARQGDAQRAGAAVVGSAGDGVRGRAHDGCPGAQQRQAQQGG